MKEITFSAVMKHFEHRVATNTYDKIASMQVSSQKQFIFLILWLNLLKGKVIHRCTKIAWKDIFLNLSKV